MRNTEDIEEEISKVNMNIRKIDDYPNGENSEGKLKNSVDNQVVLNQAAKNLDSSCIPHNNTNSHDEANLTNRILEKSAPNLLLINQSAIENGNVSYINHPLSVLNPQDNTLHVSGQNYPHPTFYSQENLAVKQFELCRSSSDTLLYRDVSKLNTKINLETPVESSRIAINLGNQNEKINIILNNQTTSDHVNMKVTPVVNPPVDNLSYTRFNNHNQFEQGSAFMKPSMDYSSYSFLNSLSRNIQGYHSGLHGMYDPNFKSEGREPFTLPGIYSATKNATDATSNSGNPKYTNSSMGPNNGSGGNLSYALPGMNPSISTYQHLLPTFVPSKGQYHPTGEINFASFTSNSDGSHPSLQSQYPLLSGFQNHNTQLNMFTSTPPNGLLNNSNDGPLLSSGVIPNNSFDSYNIEAMNISQLNRLVNVNSRKTPKNKNKVKAKVGKGNDTGDGSSNVIGSASSSELIAGTASQNLWLYGNNVGAGQSTHNNPNTNNQNMTNGSNSVASNMPRLQSLGSFPSAPSLNNMTYQNTSPPDQLPPNFNNALWNAMHLNYSNALNTSKENFLLQPFPAKDMRNSFGSVPLMIPLQLQSRTAPTHTLPSSNMPNDSMPSSGIRKSNSSNALNDLNSLGNLQSYVNHMSQLHFNYNQSQPNGAELLHESKAAMQHKINSLSSSRNLYPPGVPYAPMDDRDPNVKSYNIHLKQIANAALHGSGSPAMQDSADPSLGDGTAKGSIKRPRVNNATKPAPQSNQNSGDKLNQSIQGFNPSLANNFQMQNVSKTSQQNLTSDTSIPMNFKNSDQMQMLSNAMLESIHQKSNNEESKNISDYNASTSKPVEKGKMKKTFIKPKSESSLNSHDVETIVDNNAMSKFLMQSVKSIENKLDETTSKEKKNVKEKSNASQSIASKDTIQSAQSILAALKSKLIDDKLFPMSKIMLEPSTQSDYSNEKSNKDITSPSNSLNNMNDKDESLAALIRRREPIATRLLILESSKFLARKCPSFNLVVSSIHSPVDPNPIQKTQLGSIPLNGNNNAPKNKVVVKINPEEQLGIFAPRKKVHWDFILDEMQWMTIDFRQEFRWKLSFAKLLAEMCRDAYRVRQTMKIVQRQSLSGMNQSPCDAAALKAIASRISQSVREVVDFIAVGRRKAMEYMPWNNQNDKEVTQKNDTSEVKLSQYMLGRLEIICKNLQIRFTDGITDESKRLETKKGTRKISNTLIFSSKNNLQCLEMKNLQRDPKLHSPVSSYLISFIQSILNPAAPISYQNSMQSVGTNELKSYNRTSEGSMRNVVVIVSPTSQVLDWIATIDSHHHHHTIEVWNPLASLQLPHAVRSSIIGSTCKGDVIIVPLDYVDLFLQYFESHSESDTPFRLAGIIVDIVNNSKLLSEKPSVASKEMEDKSDALESVMIQHAADSKLVWLYRLSHSIVRHCRERNSIPPESLIITHGMQSIWSNITDCYIMLNFLSINIYPGTSTEDRHVPSPLSSFHSSDKELMPTALGDKGASFPMERIETTRRILYIEHRLMSKYICSAPFSCHDDMTNSPPIRQEVVYVEMDSTQYFKYLQVLNLLIFNIYLLNQSSSSLLSRIIRSQLIPTKYFPFNKHLFEMEENPVQSFPKILMLTKKVLFDASFLAFLKINKPNVPPSSGDDSASSKNPTHPHPLDATNSTLPPTTSEDSESKTSCHEMKNDYKTEENELDDSPETVYAAESDLPLPTTTTTRILNSLINAIGQHLSAKKFFIFPKPFNPYQSADLVNMPRAELSQRRSHPPPVPVPQDQTVLGSYLLQNLPVALTRLGGKKAVIVVESSDELQVVHRFLQTRGIFHFCDDIPNESKGPGSNVVSSLSDLDDIQRYLVMRSSVHRFNSLSNHHCTIEEVTAMSPGPSAILIMKYSSIVLSCQSVTSFDAALMHQLPYTSEAFIVLSEPMTSSMDDFNGYVSVMAGMQSRTTDHPAVTVLRIVAKHSFLEPIYSDKPVKWSSRSLPLATIPSMDLPGSTILQGNKTCLSGLEIMNYLSIKDILNLPAKADRSFFLRFAQIEKEDLRVEWESHSCNYLELLHMNRTRMSASQTDSPSNSLQKSHDALRPSDGNDSTMMGDAGTTDDKAVLMEDSSTASMMMNGAGGETVLEENVTVLPSGFRGKGSIVMSESGRTTFVKDGVKEETVVHSNDPVGSRDAGAKGETSNGLLNEMDVEKMSRAEDVLIGRLYDMCSNGWFGVEEGSEEAQVMKAMMSDLERRSIPVRDEMKLDGKSLLEASEPLIADTDKGADHVAKKDDEGRLQEVQRMKATIQWIQSETIAFLDTASERRRSRSNDSSSWLSYLACNALTQSLRSVRGLRPFHALNQLASYNSSSASSMHPFSESALLSTRSSLCLHLMKQSISLKPDRDGAGTEFTAHDLSSGSELARMTKKRFYFNGIGDHFPAASRLLKNLLHPAGTVFSTLLDGKDETSFPTHQDEEEMQTDPKRLTSVGMDPHSSTTSTSQPWPSTRNVFLNHQLLQADLQREGILSDPSLYVNPLVMACKTDSVYIPSYQRQDALKPIPSYQHAPSADVLAAFADLTTTPNAMINPSINPGVPSIQIHFADKHRWASSKPSKATGSSNSSDNHPSIPSTEPLPTTTTTKKGRSSNPTGPRKKSKPLSTPLLSDGFEMKSTAESKVHESHPILSSDGNSNASLSDPQHGFVDFQNFFADHSKAADNIDLIDFDKEYDFDVKESKEDQMLLPLMQPQQTNPSMMDDRNDPSPNKKQKTPKKRNGQVVNDFDELMQSTGGAVSGFTDPMMRSAGVNASMNHLVNLSMEAVDVSTGLLPMVPTHPTHGLSLDHSVDLTSRGTPALATPHAWYPIEDDIIICMQNSFSDPQFIHTENWLNKSKGLQRKEKISAASAKIRYAELCASGHTQRRLQDFTIKQTILKLRESILKRQLNGKVPSNPTPSGHQHNHLTESNPSDHSTNRPAGHTDLQADAKK